MYLIHVHVRRGPGSGPAGWWSPLRDRLSRMAGVRHVAVHVENDGDVVLGAYVVAGSVVSAELGVRGVVSRCLATDGPAGGATLLRCAATPIRPPVD